MDAEAPRRTLKKQERSFLLRGLSSRIIKLLETGSIGFAFIWWCIILISWASIHFHLACLAHIFRIVLLDSIVVIYFYACKIIFKVFCQLFPLKKFSAIRRLMMGEKTSLHLLQMWKPSHFAFLSYSFMIYLYVYVEMFVLLSWTTLMA